MDSRIYVKTLLHAVRFVYANAFLKAKTATQTPIEWHAISKGSDQKNVE